ncbi:hypothetical protein TRVA0_033S01178 [Trichomonascus vanleenenianus]|uniref:Cmc4p n=1 Tax=Trichomonascus vanleenenianus TaxID=2268995 RepID=UPI003EC98107
MSEQACHREACRIQDCIQQNHYDESKCTRVIDELYACCKRYYDKNGDNPKPIACPKPDLLELKLKQRREGAIDAKLVR